MSDDLCLNMEFLLKILRQNVQAGGYVAVGLQSENVSVFLLQMRRVAGLLLRVLAESK